MGPGKETVDDNLCSELAKSYKKGPSLIKAWESLKDNIRFGSKIIRIISERHDPVLELPPH